MVKDVSTLIEQRVALLDEWRGKQRQIARLQAESAGLLAQRWALMEDEIAAAPLHRDAIQRSMIAEHSAAGKVSKGSMEFAFTDARMLHDSFPAVRAAFEDGRITPGHVREILRESQPVRAAVDAGDVTPETLGLYELAVLEVAEHDTAARTRAHARQVAAALAGTTVVAQQERARSERSVTVRSVGDGLSLLQAVLPEHLAVAIHDRLTAMARHLTGHPEDRTPILPPTEPGDAEWALWEAEMAVAVRQERTVLAEVQRRRDLAQVVGEDAWRTGWVTTTRTANTGAASTRTSNTGAANTDQASTGWSSASLAVRTGLDEFGYPIDDDPNPFGLAPDADLTVNTDPQCSDDSPLIIHIPDDSRTMDQLRADLLTDLLLAGDPSEAHGSGLDNIRATIQVTVSGTTLISADDQPAELDGHGPVHPDVARALAGARTGWTRLFLNAQGFVTGTDTYTPTEPMRRYLRARDQHCRFPGCRRPVHHCQIDHNHDHALGGRTEIGNLAHFCLAHHTLKHPSIPDENRWTARQLPDQTVTWTSPTGRDYTDPAPRRVMFVPSDGAVVEPSNGEQPDARPPGPSASSSPPPESPPDRRFTFDTTAAPVMSGAPF